MKKITDDELKSISVEILKNVDSFCRDNGIDYSIAYGTLIGAVRHKGFIPWDDDIDIMMTRDNYNKFLDTFNSVNDSPYKVRYYGNHKGYPYPSAKVEDIRTINYDISYNKLGVAIDVFVVDKVPNDQDKAKRIMQKAHLIYNINQIKFIKWRKGRMIWKNIFAILSKLVTAFITYGYLSRKANEISTKNHKSSSEWVSNYMSPYGLKDIYSIHLFDEYSDIIFESINVRCINNYDEYLRTIYGDYMKLPPVEMRVSTHSPNAYYKAL